MFRTQIVDLGTGVKQVDNFSSLLGGLPGPESHPPALDEGAGTLVPVEVTPKLLGRITAIPSMFTGKSSR